MADPAVAAAARVAAMAAAAAAGRTFTKGEAPLPSASKRELGDAAVWSCSSAKPGNGVELLRDDNTDTFWQCEKPALLLRGSLTAASSGPTARSRTCSPSRSSARWSC